MVLLSVAATVVIAVAAVQAGAIGTDLHIRGESTFCLSPEAARALAEQKVEMEPIAPATASGTCVTLPGAGTMAPDITSADIPLTGGMRFTGAGHRLDVTNLRGHVRIGEGSTSADLAKDQEPATNVDFVHWPVSLSRVSLTPTTASMKNNPVTLTPEGTAAFTRAFGAGPTPDGTPLFLFEGKGELSNPFRGSAKP
ncbi:hypothetical protein Sros01_03460 [Streptomyces roseochromogenus]|nr:hypothetical protein Sros01_03460 [Streptomyces roseochromogenus]